MSRFAATIASVGCAVLAITAAGLPACGGTTGSTAPTTSPDAGHPSAPRVYRDAVAEVTAGTPDLTAVRISSDARKVSLAFSFASAPPLSASAVGGWTDMLLMGIDVPPIGAPPTPNGWMGLDYALGMHGVDDRAVFRDMQARIGGNGDPGMPPVLRTLRSNVSGREITIDLPRALIGDPDYFDFNVAVGREGADEGTDGEGDLIPAEGTARYRLRPEAR